MQQTVPMPGVPGGTGHDESAPEMGDGHFCAGVWP